MEIAAPSTRRSFVRRLFQTGAMMATAGGGAYGYGWEIERHRPVVERITVPLRGLGTAWKGFRIVQITDLHLEPLGVPGLLKTVVDTINGLKPDMVVMTGDYITHDASNLVNLAEPLADLKVPAGIFACNGNHDLWAGVSKVSKALGQHGVKYLVNDGVGFQRQNESLWVAGLDSIWGGSPRLSKALAGSPANAGAVILMHEPDYADLISRTPKPLLQLSGHTHGGQVCLPGGRPLRLPAWGKKYAKGLFDVGNIKLYVNRGIGCLDVPVRFACPPEITEITLDCV